MQVFLARVATQGLVILAVTMLGLGFPYSPAQVGLTLLTVGVPTLFLTDVGPADAARPAPAGQPGPVRRPGRGAHGGGRRRPVRLPLHVPARGPDQRRRTRPGCSPSSSATPGSPPTTSASPRRRRRSAPRPALSTFVSYAVVRCSSCSSSRRTGSSPSWTRPDGDRRPAVLVAVLVVAFSGAAVRPLRSPTTSGSPTQRTRCSATVLPALVHLVRPADRGLPLPGARPRARARAPPGSTERLPSMTGAAPPRPGTAPLGRAGCVSRRRARRGRGAPGPGRRCSPAR